MKGKKVLCIIGMHRTGTSLLAEMLKALGLNFGPDDQLNPANEFNRDGYFENMGILTLAEELLAQTNFSWCSEREWRLSLLGENLDQFQKRAHILLSRLGAGHKALCWKEPRTALLLPFWQAVLDQDPLTIITFRHPGAVIQSLYRRDFFPAHKSANIYSLYYRSIARRVNYGKALLVSFEELLAHPRQQCRRVLSFLDRQGLPLPREAERILHGLIKRSYVTATANVHQLLAGKRTEIINAAACHRLLLDWENSGYCRWPDFHFLPRANDLAADYFRLAALLQAGLPLDQAAWQRNLRLLPADNYERYYLGKTILLDNEYHMRQPQALQKKLSMQTIQLLEARSNPTANDCLLIGSLYYQRHEYDQSSHWLKRMLQVRALPQSVLAKAYGLLSEISRQKKQKGWKALLKKRLLILEAKKEAGATDWLELGWKWHMLGETDRSARFLQKALATGSLTAEQKARVYFTIADIDRKKGNLSWQKWVDKGIRAAARKKERTAAEMLHWARLCQKIGKQEESLTWLKRIVRLDNDGPGVVHQEAARLLLSEVQSPVAKAAQLIALRILSSLKTKKLADAWLLAIKYFELGKHLASAPFWRKVCAAKKANISQRLAACLNLAKIGQMQNRPRMTLLFNQRAAALLESKKSLSITEMQDLIRSHLSLGEKQRASHWHERLANCPEADITIRKNSWYWLGQLRKEQGDNDWRGYYLQGIALLAGKEVKSLYDQYEIAKTLFKIGEKKQSRQWFSQVAGLVDGDVNYLASANFYLGALAKENAEKDWLDHVRRGVAVLQKKRRKTARDYYVLGEKLHLLGELSKSAKHFRQVLRCTEASVTDLSGAYFFLGDMAQKKSGNRWREHYRRGIDILEREKLEKPLAEYRIASLYKRIGDYAMAKSRFRQISAQSSNMNLVSGARFHLGEISYFTERNEEGWRNLRQCYLAREQKDLVSVVMPTWNRAFVIERALSSALRQSYRHWELLVVDDGSSDETRSLIQRWQSNDGRIKYFPAEHQGVSHARNIGLEKASGSLVAYLDSDNEWAEDYLLFMVHSLADHPQHSTAYAGIRVLDQVKREDKIRLMEYDRKVLLHSNFIDLNIFMHRRELYSILGGFNRELTRLVDWELIIRYCRQYPPYFVKNVLATYYMDHRLQNITYTQDWASNFNKIRQIHKE